MKFGSVSHLSLWCLLFHLFRIEYEDQQDSLLKAMKQNVGPRTQMVSDTHDELSHCSPLTENITTLVPRNDNADIEASLFANKKLFKKEKSIKILHEILWKKTVKHFSAADNVKILNKSRSARIRNSSLDVLI